MSVNTDTLTSMCELIVDCPHSTPEWTDHGYLVTRNQNIKNGVLNLSSPSFTNRNDYLKRIKRAEPRAGDIIFTREAPMGEVCMIPAGLQCCLGQRQVLLRPKDDVCGRYLFWALQSPFVQHQIAWNEGTGSTVSNVRIPVLKALNIPRQPGEEEYIAKVLSDLAEKIELNRQSNQTLEHMAQAIFKSWFVDFEPTRAKIAAKEEWAKRNMTAKAGGSDNNIKESQAEATFVERAAMAAISGRAIDSTNDSDTGALAGLDQLNPEQIQQLKITAALFSDALEGSELGEIPEGWGVKEIKELSLKISKGTTPSKGDMQKAEDPETISFLKVRDISGSGEIRRAGLDRVPESVHTGSIKRSILQTNDLLFSIAGTIGRVALIEEELSNSNCNQAVAFIRLKEPNKHLELCRLNLVGSRVQNEVMSKVVQGVQANFSLTGLGEIQILIPSDDLLASFNEKLESAFKKQRLLLSENRKLEKVRDTLLPMLLSGDLSVGGESHESR